MISIGAPCRAGSASGANWLRGGMRAGSGPAANGSYGAGMTISELLIPSFTQSLNALSAWLAKGAAFEAAAGRDPDGRTGLRIAPDMSPLATQVCFCCYQGQEFAYRLQDEP